MLRMLRTSIRSAVAFGIKHLLGASVVKHYLAPFMVRGRRIPYEAKNFFEQHYSTAPGGVITDRFTIGRRFDENSAALHYFSIESRILTYLNDRRRVNADNQVSVLDIGSGAGHWIEFYLRTFRTARVTGVDLSSVCVRHLAERYAGDTRVIILSGDIVRRDAIPAQCYDIINAIGVIFHIVDDRSWLQALQNIATRLNPGGLMVVSGQFGLITRDVQFGSRDAKSFRVQKRIRSLRRWKQCAAQAGLRIDTVSRSALPKIMWMPENNLLFLERVGSSQ
jgi:SAM-dependent methyltransferase